MASEPDDNPFARSSLWPKMPQAPFRVGPLPKGEPSTAPSEPAQAPLSEASTPEVVAPRTITPLFVRPVNPPISSLAPAVERPVTPPPPAAQRMEPPPPQPPAAEAAPSGPPVAPSAMVVTAPRAARPRPVRARSRLPAVAATFVGLGGVAGLIYLLTRGEPTPPPVAVAPAPIAEPPPVAAVPPATVPVTAEFIPPPAPAAVVAIPPSPARLTASPTRPPGPPPPRRTSLPSDAARATEEALGAPVLALGPTPPPSPPEPARVYVPPVAADPGAPIKTQRPY